MKDRNWSAIEESLKAPLSRRGPSASLHPRIIGSVRTFEAPSVPPRTLSLPFRCAIATTAAVLALTSYRITVRPCGPTALSLQSPAAAAEQVIRATSLLTERYDAELNDLDKDLSGTMEFLSSCIPFFSPEAAPI